LKYIEIYEHKNGCGVSQSIDEDDYYENEEIEDEAASDEELETDEEEVDEELNFESEEDNLFDDSEDSESINIQIIRNKSDEYIGSIKDNVKSGDGIYKYVNTDGCKVKYIGEFKNDEMDGSGVIAFSSGQKYIGEFRNVDYEGYGIYKYEDGSAYIGQWKMDKKHGHGLLIDSDGNATSVYYEDGELIEE
jgi:hypothetical protein